MSLELQALAAAEQEFLAGLGLVVRIGPRQRFVSAVSENERDFGVNPRAQVYPVREVLGRGKDQVVQRQKAGVEVHAPKSRGYSPASGAAIRDSPRISRGRELLFETDGREFRVGQPVRRKWLREPEPGADKTRAHFAFVVIGEVEGDCRAVLCHRAEFAGERRFGPLGQRLVAGQETDDEERRGSQNVTRRRKSIHRLRRCTESTK